MGNGLSNQRCALPDDGCNLPLILRASGVKDNGNQVEDGSKAPRAQVPSSRFQVPRSWLLVFSTAQLRLAKMVHQAGQKSTKLNSCLVQRLEFIVGDVG